MLGTVNPFDFDLASEEIELVAGLHFGRSVPVSDLAVTLVQQGHEVTVIGIAKMRDAVLSLTSQDGVKLVYVRGRTREKLKALTFYSKERKLILEQIASIKPDVVNAHWTYEYALAAQDSGLPHVITVHDEPFEILRDFRNFYFFLRLLHYN